MINIWPKVCNQTLWFGPNVHNYLVKSQDLPPKYEARGLKAPTHLVVEIAVLLYHCQLLGNKSFLGISLVVHISLHQSHKIERTQVNAHHQLWPRNFIWNDEHNLPLEQCKSNTFLLLVHVSFELISRQNQYHGNKYLTHKWEFRMPATFQHLPPTKIRVTYLSILVWP